MKRTFSRQAAWFLVTALLVPGAHGIEAPQKVAACQLCHGSEGISVSGDIPNLAGQKQGYLARQLQAFRDGTRKNDLMSPMAVQLGDDDIKALAAYWSSLPGAGAAGSSPAAAGTGESRMAFPADFPQGFTVYETIDAPDAKVITRRYANAVALAAARARHALPDGSVLITATWSAQLDGNGKPVVDDKGLLVAGAVRNYSGMEARAGWGDDVPPLLRNGEWHYGLFNAEGKPTIGTRHAQCLACHKPKQSDSYVFTLRQLQDRATQ